MKNNGEDRNGFFSFFGGMDKLFNIVSDMVENDQDHTFIKGDIKSDDQKKVVGKYGINFVLGPDKLEGFNNLSSQKDKPSEEIKPNIISPATDVFHQEDRVTIVAELPGVRKEDIELHLDKNLLVFQALKKDGIYYKQVELDFAPEYQAITENYQNSVYSIVVMKNQS